MGDNDDVEYTAGNETANPKKKSSKKILCLLCFLSIASLGVGSAGLGIAIVNKNKITGIDIGLQYNIRKWLEVKREVRSWQDHTYNTMRKVNSMQSSVNSLSYSVSRLQDNVKRMDSQLRRLDNSRKKGYYVYSYWYELYNGYEYQRITSAGKNWTESRKTCQQRGGDLAVYGMQNLHSRRILYQALRLNSAKTPTWIGLNQTEDGQFEWVNGDPTDQENTFWSHTPKNGSCGALFPEDIYTKAAGCEGIYSFLCERRS